MTAHRDVQSTARDLAGRRFCVVPVAERGKNPTPHNWQKMRITAADAANHFNGVVNIGVILGGPSGNLADVDLDCAEAVAAAPFLLPPTPWVTGRASSPRSHYWYRCPSGMPACFQPRDPVNTAGDHGSLLLELRVGCGEQTVVPPSVHESGEDVVHYGDPNLDPAEVDADELTDAVRWTGAAALLARNLPRGEQRHNSALFIAGALKSWGWPQERTERFVEAVATAAGHQSIKDRRKCVTDTYAKQGATAGWGKLADLVSPAVLKLVKDLVGLKVAATADALVPVKPYVPFPVNHLPPVVRDYVEQGAVALGCDRAYLALPALSALGGLIGNRRRIRLKRTWSEPAVIWSVVVARSGTLKSPAHELVVQPVRDVQTAMLAKFAQEMQEYNNRQTCADGEGKKKKGAKEPEPVLQRLIVADTTVEAMAPILLENPQGLLLVRDELAGWIKSFNQYKKGGADLSHWLEAHRAGPILIDRKTPTRKTYYIPRAAVSVSGTIQPRTMARCMTDEYRDAGLSARLLMAMPPPEVKQWNETVVDPDVEAAYRRLVEDVIGLHPEVNDDGTVRPAKVKLGREAKGLWVEFYNQWGRVQAEASDDGAAAAFAKIEGYAARLALLYHVVAHVAAGAADDRELGERAMESGITLARWFAYEHERVSALLSESDGQAETRELVELIKSVGGVITTRGLMRKRRTRYPTSEDAEAALDGLAKAGLGRWLETQHGPRGGNPARRFQLHDTTGVTVDSCDSWPDAPAGPHGGGEPEPRDKTDSTGGNPQENGGTVTTVNCHNGLKWDSDAPPARVADPTAEEVLSHPPESATCGPAGPLDFLSKFNEDFEPFRYKPPAKSAGQGDDTPKPKTDRTYTLVADPADLPMVVTAVGQSTNVGLDTETTGLNPRTDRLRLLSLDCDGLDGRHAYVIDCFMVDPAPLWDGLAAATVIGHNLAFDLPFLARLGFAPGACTDTMLAAQVLDAGDPTKKHTLADLTERFLGRELDKGLQSSDWSSELTREQLDYAANDAAVLVPLADAISKPLTTAKLDAAKSCEQRALPTVAWMAAAGVGFDRDRWTALAAEAEAEVKSLEVELNATAPDRGGEFFTSWKWSSPVDVKTALELATGKPVESTADDALAGIDHPLAGLVRRHRAASKMTGTYGLDFVKHVSADSRIYARWGQNVTGTGRMTCSSPNLQNLPRDPRYRQCFAAPPGRVLVKADYSQIELRIAAKVSGDEALVEAYRNGEDLHARTARTVLDVDEPAAGQRQLAKSLNFGLLYGMGAKAFAGYARSNFGLAITEAEAAKYRAAFFKAYPGLKRWHSKAGATTDRSIDTRTLTGRRRLGVTRFTEKLNSPVQGTGADGLKLALAQLWERRQEVPDAFPVLAVHDEIVIEAPEGAAEVAAAWLKRAMVDAMAPLLDPVPVEVEVWAGQTWGG